MKENVNFCGKLKSCG